MIGTCLAAVRPAGAPTTPAAGAPAAPAALRPRITRTLSTNPIALPFGAVSAEGEQAIGSHRFAVGVGAPSTFTRTPSVANDGGSAAFRSFQLKAKYYAREDGLRGFAVGVTAGVAPERELRVRSSVTDAAGRETVLFEQFAARTAPTLGATLDDNFLLGPGGASSWVSAPARGGRAVPRGTPLGGPLVDGRLQLGIGF